MSEDDITPIESGRKNQDEVTGKTEEAKRIFWSQALMKLTESQRFLEFIDRNYVIGIHKDEETKTVEVRVVEKPVISGPPLSAEQRFKLHVACLRSGAKDPMTLMNHIFKLLGQEPPSKIISSVDDAELKRAVAEAEAQDALKKGLDE